MSNKIQPKDIDLTNKLGDVFEDTNIRLAVCAIVRFLNSDQYAAIPAWIEQKHYEWGKRFCDDTIKGITPEIFAQLKEREIVSPCYFPKNTFTLAETVVNKLVERQKKCQSTPQPS